jgi:hypothetical protein
MKIILCYKGKLKVLLMYVTRKKVPQWNILPLFIHLLIYLFVYLFIQCYTILLGKHLEKWPDRIPSRGFEGAWPLRKWSW